MLRQLLLIGLSILVETGMSLANAEGHDIGIFQQVSSPNKHQTKVFMLATPYCGYCKQARYYFRQRGIAWQEKDVSKQNIAVPVIFVCGQRMEGWSEGGFEYYLQHCH
jgi:glutaredoxin